MSEYRIGWLPRYVWITTLKPAEKREWAGVGQCSQCELGIPHTRDDCGKHYPPEGGNES